MIPRCHNLHLRAVRTEIILAFYFYFMDQWSACVLDFIWGTIPDLDWTKYLWGLYFLVGHFVRYVAHGIYYWGFVVSSLINGTVGNLSSNTTWNLGDTWQVSVLRTRYTDPEWNGEWPRHIPGRERVSQLVNQIFFLAIFHPMRKLERTMCDDFWDLRLLL